MKDKKKVEGSLRAITLFDEDMSAWGVFAEYGYELLATGEENEETG